MKKLTLKTVFPHKNLSFGGQATICFAEGPMALRPNLSDSLLLSVISYIWNHDNRISDYSFCQ